MAIALYVIGMLSVLVGGYTLYSGVMMDTSVESAADIASVANLQLMHMQSANLMIGCAFWIIAAITLSSGVIVETLRKRDDENRN